MKKKTKILKSTDVLNIINESLEKDKALEINTIDLINRSSIADHMIIASGSSSRHVASMSNNLIKKLKDCGIKAKKPEGLINSDWVLVDVNDIIVHLFRPEVREFYKLDKMWEMPNSNKSNKSNKLK